MQADASGTRDLDPGNLKQCSRCQRVLPIGSFHQHRAAPDGRVKECKDCVRERHHRWYAANREQRRAASRAQYAKSSEHIKAQVARWARENPERRREIRRAWDARRRRSDRDAVFAAYGNACSCCGETEPLFLSIDHMNDDGAAHRRQIGGGGAYLYHWLRLNRFPPGFQTLCRNCNWGRWCNDGTCPHQIVIQEVK